MRLHWLFLAIAAAVASGSWIPGRSHVSTKSDKNSTASGATIAKSNTTVKSLLSPARRADYDDECDSNSTTTVSTRIPELVKPKRKDQGKKRGRSTSSSSGEKSKKDSDEESSDGDSLKLSDDSGSGDSDDSRDNKKYVPVSTEERHGWRKWHRKCPPCPESMKWKWRDPNTKWICGAYQRARRSFKTMCLMRLRNCQDGTMFVKIHDNRCNNDTYHGEHFMYDYNVKLTDDSSDSDDSDVDSEDDETEEDTDYSDD